MLKTKPLFQEPTAADAAWAAPMLASAGRMGCEYSYAAIYMWRTLYGTRMAKCGDYLLIGVGGDEQTSFLPPVGPSLIDGVELLREYTAQRGLSLRLHSVGEDVLEPLLAHYGDRLSVTESRSDFDYIYRTADLAQLPGKAYHSKKNHVSAFSRKFEWQYEAINDDNAADVIKMAKQWCAERGTCRDRGLSTERCAIGELLRDRDRLSVKGGLIRVEGAVAAFTLGSPINGRVFDVHVEKALSAYPGAYAVINREFASHLTAYEYLNREDDMGIEGLRKAKTSYHPSILLKKFICEIR